MPLKMTRKRKISVNAANNTANVEPPLSPVCSGEESRSRLRRSGSRLMRMMSLTRDRSSHEYIPKDTTFGIRSCRARTPTPLGLAERAIARRQLLLSKEKHADVTPQPDYLPLSPISVNSIETSGTSSTGLDHTGKNTPRPDALDGPANSLLTPESVCSSKAISPSLQTSQSSPTLGISRHIPFLTSSTIKRYKSRSSKLKGGKSDQASSGVESNRLNIPDSDQCHAIKLNLTTALRPRIENDYSPLSTNDAKARLSNDPSDLPQAKDSLLSTVISVPSYQQRSNSTTRKLVMSELETSASEVSSLSKSSEDLTGSVRIRKRHVQTLCPSIALVEKTAAAKVYFETFYNSVGGTTYRSLRRMKMENGLITSNKSPVEAAEIRQLFFRDETDHLRETRGLKTRKAHEPNGFSAAGYEMIRVLGKGSFGVVSLVREQRRDGLRATSRSGAVYAMKVIRKSEMLRTSQEGHTRAERDFLVSCAERSKWVVPLVSSFQDMDSLYLVMEFQIGGDFLNFLLNAKGGIISEDWTRWYIAEMILCVEEAHKMRWIHRDVKPDNFLISASGHLKISDFGLAFDGHWAHTQAYYTNHRYSLIEKLGIEVRGDEDDKPPALPPRGGQTVSASTLKFQRLDKARFSQRRLARSIVGTSQYMAPEVVSGQWYDGRCDWWSIGIIAFECLYGITPFCRKDRDTTKRAIANHTKEFMFPRDEQPISREAKDLVFRLLQHKQIRLSSRKYLQNDYKRDMRGMAVLCPEDEKSSQDFDGHHVYPNDADDIKQHSFFRTIPWNHLHMTRPPFVPRVKREDSTKYFDSEEQILADCSSIEDSFVTAAAGKKSQPEVDNAAKLDGVDGGREAKIPAAPKKRPRDKLLRDPKTAKTVLEVRKKSAFLGYTYRRPKTWSLGDDIRLADSLDHIGFAG